MTIRWKKLAPIVAVIIGVGIVIGLVPHVATAIAPERFSGIACVRVYPDQRVEKDYGDSCYDPELPEAIVLKNK